MSRSGSAAAIFAVLIALSLAAMPLPAAAVPDVLVTVKPVHALVAGVMEGVGEPDLLLEGAASAHSYAMRPSDARLLTDADVVFWIGEGYETFMARPLSTLAKAARIVELSADAGIPLLRTREGGDWEAHANEDEHGHDLKGEPHERGEARGAFDMHIWLDPENARRIVDKAAAVLTEEDPANEAAYAANAAKVKQKLDALDAELRDALRPVKKVAYIVFHDAYQYFERRFATNAVGSITVGPGRLPGAKRLYDIRRRIVQSNARCVFSEPQFEPALVQTVMEGMDARTGVLDPLGADVPAGPDAYFAIMRNLARSLAGCLSGQAL